MGEQDEILHEDSFNDSYESKCYIEEIVIPEIIRYRKDERIKKDIISTLYLGKNLGSVISFPEDPREKWFLFKEMPELEKFDIFNDEDGEDYKVLLKKSPYDMQRLFDIYGFAYDGRKQNKGIILCDISLEKEVARLVKKEKGLNNL